MSVVLLYLSGPLTKPPRRQAFALPPVVEPSLLVSFEASVRSASDSRRAVNLQHPVGAPGGEQGVDEGLEELCKPVQHPAQQAQRDGSVVEQLAHSGLVAAFHGSPPLGDQDTQ